MQISMASQRPMPQLPGPDPTRDRSGAFGGVLDSLGEFTPPPKSRQATAAKAPSDTPPADQETHGAPSVDQAERIRNGPDMVSAADPSRPAPGDVPPGSVDALGNIRGLLGPAPTPGLTADRTQVQPGFDLPTAIARAGNTDQPSRPSEIPSDRGSNLSRSGMDASTGTAQPANVQDRLAPGSEQAITTDPHLLPAAWDEATDPPDTVAVRGSVAAPSSVAQVAETALSFEIAKADAATASSRRLNIGQMGSGQNPPIHATPPATEQGTTGASGLAPAAQDYRLWLAEQNTPPTLQTAAFTRSASIHPESGSAEAQAQAKQIRLAQGGAQPLTGRSGSFADAGSGLPSSDSMPREAQPSPQAGIVRTAGLPPPAQNWQPASASSSAEITQGPQDLLGSREPVVPSLSVASPGGTGPSNSVTAAPVHQVAQSVIQFVKTGGKSPIELTLRPEELGRMRFDITTSGDRISVILFIERPDAMDLIRRHGEHLLNDLRLSGFSNPSLSFGEWSQRNARPGAPPDQTGGASPDTAPGANPVAFGSTQQASPAGRLDLRL
ncbi:MAG: flagellar hook-length control protein FliK [Paracoccaceae bacterium]